MNRKKSNKLHDSQVTQLTDFNVANNELLISLDMNMTLYFKYESIQGYDPKNYKVCNTNTVCKNSIFRLNISLITI